MGKMKEVKVCGRIIQVNTISFAGMMKILGKQVTPQDIVDLCIKEADYEYLNSIDFESFEQLKEANELFNAIVEVNQGLFKNPLPQAQKTLTEKELNGNGNSGQVITSDGNPAK
jgi:hypothetical protein